MKYRHAKSLVNFKSMLRKVIPKKRISLLLAKKQKFQTKRQILKTKKMENIKVMNALREIYKFEKDFVLPRHGILVCPSSDSGLGLDLDNHKNQDDNGGYDNEDVFDKNNSLESLKQLQCQERMWKAETEQRRDCNEIVTVNGICCFCLKIP